jgi:REP element-mobilizing transposase RayT
MKTDHRHQGWYSRGYIPHYDGGNMYQVITYRLVDSLPKSKLIQLMGELQETESRDIKTKRRMKIEKWLDAGHGCCILQNPACARIVIEAWKYFDGVRYDLVAWVVMPNHVHVLAYFREGWPMGKVVNSWKSYTARKINKIIASQGGGPKLSDKSCPTRLWQRGYWDRYIRSEAHFNHAIGYILQNPVTAGLVEKTQDWPFSKIETRLKGRCLRWRPPDKSVSPKPDKIYKFRNYNAQS